MGTKGAFLLILACTAVNGAVLSETPDSHSILDFSEIFSDHSTSDTEPKTPFRESDSPQSVSAANSNQQVRPPDYWGKPGLPSLPPNQIQGGSWNQPLYPQFPPNQGNYGQSSYGQCLMCRPSQCSSYPYRLNEIQLSADETAGQTILQDGAVTVVERQTKVNSEGTQENRIVLSNGLVIYQKVGVLPKDRGQMPNLEGFYSQKLIDHTYLTTFYKVNQKGYIVKSEVSMTPPTVVGLKDLPPVKETNSR